MNETRRTALQLASEVVVALSEPGEPPHEFGREILRLADQFAAWLGEGDRLILTASAPQPIPTP